MLELPMILLTIGGWLGVFVLVALVFAVVFLILIYPSRR